MASSPSSESVRVTVLPEGRVIEAPRGSTLLAVLRGAGVFVDASCGGEGRCGRCTIELLSGRLLDGDDEEMRTGRHLACRARAESDLSLRIPSADRIRTWIHGPASPAPKGPLFAGFDLGTTTLSVSASSEDGLPFLELRALNPQASWGSDVLRRLSAAGDPRERRALSATLREAVKSLFESLVEEAGVSLRRFEAASAGANSAVTVLYLGLDPAPLSTAPFRSGLEALGTLGLDPKLLGLHEKARAFFLPAVGSFVGSDVTAGLLASALDRGPRPALFLDAGTNGEMVLAPETGPLLVASTAAGPAFEGGHLSCGGPGSRGAVSGVRFTGDGLRLDVIGGGPARWICGSGALQLVAGLVARSVILRDGRFAPDAPVLDLPGGEKAFFVGEGPSGPIRFTQGDVREVQLAVGAVRTGWRILLRKAGLRPDDLKRIVVTGVFGGALDASVSRELGLLPAVPIEVETLPSGASRGLLSAATGIDPRARWEALVRNTLHVPLGDASFQELFVESLSLEPFPG